MKKKKILKVPDFLKNSKSRKVSNNIELNIIKLCIELFLKSFKNIEYEENHQICIYFEVIKKYINKIWSEYKNLSTYLIYYY